MWLHHFMFTLAMYEGSNFSSSPVLILCLFYYSHPCGCEMVSLRGLICMSLMTNDTELLFIHCVLLNQRQDLVWSPCLSLFHRKVHLENVLPPPWSSLHGWAWDWLPGSCFPSMCGRGIGPHSPLLNRDTSVPSPWLRVGAREKGE